MKMFSDWQTEEEKLRDEFVSDGPMFGSGMRQDEWDEQYAPAYGKLVENGVQEITINDLKKEVEK